MYRVRTYYENAQIPSEELNEKHLCNVESYCANTIGKAQLYLVREGVWQNDNGSVRMHVNFLPEIDMKWRRHTMGYTQEEFAQAMGVTRGAISHWEGGVRKPPAVAHLLMRYLPKKDYKRRPRSKKLTEEQAGLLG